MQDSPKEDQELPEGTSVSIPATPDDRALGGMFEGEIPNKATLHIRGRNQRSDCHK